MIKVICYLKKWFKTELVPWLFVSEGYLQSISNLFKIYLLNTHLLNATFLHIPLGWMQLQ